MSDTGLFGSVYEQLREYSDKLDALLVEIQSTREPQRTDARQRLAALLRTVADVNNKSPSAQVIRLVLRRKLSSILGRPDNLCNALAMALERRDPSKQELDQLEKIATVVDTERQTTMARMRGRP
jgi:phage-related minor tail protein